MTPKERLKRLESYSVCDNYREKEEDFREIEKALEILEILKCSVKYKEEHKYILNERMKGQKFMLIDFTVKGTIKGTDNVNKVKEWLENDND